MDSSPLLQFLSRYDIISQSLNNDYSQFPGSMSDAAKTIWRTVETTPKFAVTDRALPRRLSAEENAFTENCHTLLNQESVVLENDAWEVQVFAEGGYQYVWLVCYTVAHHVRRPNLPALLRLIVLKKVSDGTETISPSKVTIFWPKEEASACQIENESAFLTSIAKNPPINSKPQNLST